MPPEGGRPIRVLHVEDDPAFADLVATFLAREHPDIVVQSAGDAESGLSALSACDVDCVVSDFDMPGMDGLGLLEAVRERRPGLPFILFTGKGSEEIASRAISAGVTDYLQKESGTDQFAVLANRIEHAVGKARTETELERTRERYELIGRASADAFWDYDIRTGEVERSEGFARLFGYDEGEIGDTHDWWRERVHPDGWEEVVEALGRTMERGEEMYESEYRFRNSDGTYSDIYSRGYVVYDEDGEPLRAVGSLTDVTDLKRREREIESVRTRLEIVLDGTDTGVWEWDPATDEVWWDAAVERLFAMPEGSFEGTIDAVFRRIFDADRGRVEEAIEQTLSREQRYGVEFRIRRDDGVVRWVRAEGVMIDEDGAERMIGLVKDIDERREREERLKRIERRFEATFDDPSVFMGLLEPDGTVIRTSRAGAEFLQSPSEERIGRPFLETEWWVDASPEKRAEVERAIEQAADGGFARFQGEHENELGETVSIESHVRPVTDEDDEVVSLVVEGIDVSERQERERMIESLHEATRELVLAEDPETVARLVADAAEEILGHEINVVRLLDGQTLEPAAVSESARDVFGERPDYTVGEGLPGETLTRGEPIVVDDLHALDDEYERGSLGSGLYVPLGEHGTLSIGDAATGAFDDSDVYLARVLATNAGAVLDRLAGEQSLRRRERELERQNERLERFATVVSHDLRNPLTVAQGRLEMVETESEHVEHVERALDRMSALIEDVLRLSRDGRLVGDVEPIEVDRVARSAWATVETKAATLSVAESGTVTADEGRLRDLFENLFRNAVEHGVAFRDGGVAEGEATVSVRVGPLSDGNGFFVEDDGPGIPPGDRESVLEPGVSTREEGTGFGLAIVAEIARAHDWAVEVTDGSEGGARIEVETDPRSG